MTARLNVDLTPLGDADLTVSSNESSLTVRDVSAATLRKWANELTLAADLI